MANIKTQSLLLATLIMVGALILSDSKVSGFSDNCDDNKLKEAGVQCFQYVKISGPKIPPSKECCDVLKNADMNCICKHVTPEVEKMVSVEKIVYVAQTCGLAFSPGTKCGSHTVRKD
ncbi:hypothetical protein JCGZ_09425 [Jatropha curcas]|uniref:Bifunctional inhibitor/plant lipid transfer protein/seed storage helical domain-containing protein n=1 Tax=Jatropha curcas TaxID=180498 RepID=A0A067KGD1_JATCU|nr:uncharacterized protein LOC105636561 [Jatropha curcas]KDP35266.1 hypothetical protein JCGZ_09425 [Jatropha curcas]